MNHDRAAQLIDPATGEPVGWHFVSGNRRIGTHPIGDCASHGPHPTELEARECYAAYLRARIRLDGATLNWGSCEARLGEDSVQHCPQPAKRYARVEGDPYSHAQLCEEHMTVEHATVALGLNGPVGDRWHS